MCGINGSELELLDELELLPSNLLDKLITDTQGNFLFLRDPGRGEAILGLFEDYDKCSYPTANFHLNSKEWFYNRNTASNLHYNIFHEFGPIYCSPEHIFEAKIITKKCEIEELIKLVALSEKNKICENIKSKLRSANKENYFLVIKQFDHYIETALADIDFPQHRYFSSTSMEGEGNSSAQYTFEDSSFSINRLDLSNDGVVVSLREAETWVDHIYKTRLEETIKDLTTLWTQRHPAE